MDDKIKRYHMDVLSMYKNSMYNTLLQPHHVTSPNLKEFEFNEGSVTAKGYFAMKDKTKYFLQPKMYQDLPIRIIDTQELKYREDVIERPIKYSTFKVIPKQTMSVKDLVDGFAPFTHTQPDMWTLTKIIAMQSYIGKSFICIATEPNFGKSSIFSILHSLTDKVPVFKPRSVPGVLNKINTTGNMVFDEAHESSKDVKDIMEEFSLSIAGGSVQYINGAMKSAHTKNIYDCRLQSITFLYNTVECYKQADKKYFEVLWSNNRAMDNRFLKLKLDGIMTQKFHRDFDITGTADTNKKYYMNIHKMLLYLQEFKQTGAYERQYTTNSTLNVKGRRLLVYDEITWLVDMYCDTQAEYDKFINLLDSCIIQYKEMVSVLNPNPTTETEEEKVE